MIQTLNISDSRISVKNRETSATIRRNLKRVKKFGHFSLFDIWIHINECLKKQTKDCITLVIAIYSCVHLDNATQLLF